MVWKHACSSNSNSDRAWRRYNTDSLEKQTLSHQQINIFSLNRMSQCHRQCRFAFRRIGAYAPATRLHNGKAPYGRCLCHWYMPVPEFGTSQKGLGGSQSGVSTSGRHTQPHSGSFQTHSACLWLQHGFFKRQMAGLADISSGLQNSNSGGF